MKKFWFIAIILWYHVPLIAQWDSTSVLTHENYFIDPVEYLSEIDSGNITTGILLDRDLANDIILSVDGVVNVTAINVEDWVDVYQNLRYANYDTLFLPHIDSFQMITEAQHRYDRTYTIGMIDFKFNRIKQTAIDNGYMVETASGLVVQNPSSDLFSTNRAFVSSVLSHHIYGDTIGFFVGDFYFLTNIDSLILQQVEIDFGNGEGFQAVTLNEVTYVDYGSNSEFITIITKLKYLNTETNGFEFVSSHSTVFRTGSSTVPLPDIIIHQPPSARVNHNNYSVREDYYPKSGVQYVMKYVVVDGLVRWMLVSVIDKSITNIQYYIMYSPQNIEEKQLRRPFIICDGFDVGNKRDYYENNLSYVHKLLEKEKDTRGLCQLLNGDPSPWYIGKPTANLIADLQNDGYDIVIINFLNGAGDIPTNAGENGLRGFLNDVINSPTYRDNKTEEAVFIGPSMGGIISRYALTSMEQATPYEDPYVKLWISFDSPQEGANLSLGIQQSIRMFSSMSGNSSFQHDAREGFKRGVSALNTPAAKQMLLAHEAANGGPSSLFIDLYTTLQNLGHPIFSKNIAISNGGSSKLYPSNGQEILNFKMRFWNANWAKAWSYSNSNGSGTVMDGHRKNHSETHTSHNQIGLDNAPGGWTALAYPLNFNDGNKYQRTDDTEILTSRTTFMVTTSAFGVEVNSNNVYKTWKDYTGIMQNLPGKEMTPFDVVYGINGICEEHVRISEETGRYLIEDVLQPEFKESQRPRNRLNVTINQNVNGPVAYTAKEKFTLGGSGNIYTAQTNADINIKAGEEVVFLPGFSTEDGANITAEITNVDYSTVFMKTNVPYTQPVDYSKQSPYLGQVFNYSTITGVEEFNELNSIRIYPNPVKNELVMQLKGFESYTNLELHIYSSTGKLVYSDKISANQEVTINVYTFAQGVYYCKVVTNDIEIHQSEFVKIK